MNIKLLYWTAMAQTPTDWELVSLYAFATVRMPAMSMWVNHADFQFDSKWDAMTSAEVERE